MNSKLHRVKIHFYVRFFIKYHKQYQCLKHLPIWISFMSCIIRRKFLKNIILNFLKIASKYNSNPQYKEKHLGKLTSRNHGVNFWLDSNFFDRYVLKIPVSSLLQLITTDIQELFGDKIKFIFATRLPKPSIISWVKLVNLNKIRSHAGSWFNRFVLPCDEKHAKIYQTLSKQDKCMSLAEIVSTNFYIVALSCKFFNFNRHWFQKIRLITNLSLVFIPIFLFTSSIRLCIQKGFAAGRELKRNLKFVI